jgi:hypothetical protein
MSNASFNKDTSNGLRWVPNCVKGHFTLRFDGSYMGFVSSYDPNQPDKKVWTFTQHHNQHTNRTRKLFADPRPAFVRVTKHASCEAAKEYAESLFRS